MAHLLSAISPHGFGHTAQVAPVLNALSKQIPELQLTLRTTVPRFLLESRIGGDFDIQADADDFGMQQHDALDVDVVASSRLYRSLHAEWDREVDRVAARLDAVAPDLILADVPYLALAAARRAGIPAMAMCCLNWADIYLHYCRLEPGAATIHEQMLEAYNSAELFMKTEPSMPMPGLDNTLSIGPVAASGTDRRDELNERLGLSVNERLVLVAMGGISMRLPMEQWPEFPGVRFIVQRNWQVSLPDVVELESLRIHFNDILASCDVLLTKPGYGSFTEAAVNGVPVLYVPRDDWPEQPYLIDWLHEQGNAIPISRDKVMAGSFAKELRLLLEYGRYPPVEPKGVDDATALLAERLSRSVRLKPYQKEF